MNAISLLLSNGIKYFDLKNVLFVLFLHSIQESCKFLIHNIIMPQHKNFLNQHSKSRVYVAIQQQEFIFIDFNYNIKPVLL